MALDEALLESMSRLGRPVLRFYGWTEPAATFGYFQKYADVERATLLRPLIRRPTGGGIVPHDADWTYSLAFPPGHEWHSLKAEASYRRVHEWIRRAFAKLERDNGTRTPLPEIRSQSGPMFFGYEKFDLLWNGKKIAGAAQRRNKLGLLIQGSVQRRRFLCPRPIGIRPCAMSGARNLELRGRISRRTRRCGNARNLWSGKNIRNWFSLAIGEHHRLKHLQIEPA